MNERYIVAIGSSEIVIQREQESGEPGPVLYRKDIISMLLSMGADTAIAEEVLSRIEESEEKRVVIGIEWKGK